MAEPGQPPPSSSRRPARRRITKLNPGPAIAAQPWTGGGSRATTKSGGQDLRRRVLYLMLFRLVLISLVLGATILLWWLSNVDLVAPSSLILFAIIIATYLLTIIYALVIVKVADVRRLADVQLVLDLIISALLVHVTGGVQSAYTFFFPLSIIAAATVRFRVGAVVIAAVSMLLFTGVGFLGWREFLPVPAGQQLLPSDLSPMGFSRALGLNLAAFAAVAGLAYNLGAQIQQTSASLETQRTVAADLYTVHEDIVRCLSSGLITVDNRCVVLMINRAACEILATNSGAAVGRPLDEILPGVGSLLDKVTEREIVRRADLVIRRPNRAAQPLGLSISPLRNNRDHVIGRIINFQDLTELREMEKQVRQTERLAVIGTLVAGVAHEIRNPLAAISGSIELLRATPQVDEDGRTLMGIVTREVDRLNALISELLDYSNPQPREMVCFDLSELVGETLRVFERDPTFGDLDVGFANGKPAAIPVTGEPGRIRQMLWNLLRNGAEAARNWVRVRVEQRGDSAVIEVSDDGPGIPREDIDHIFDPFFTTKSQGSGLGLATCYSIIREHGGTIQAENRPQGGCLFSIRLPLRLHQRGAGDRANTGAGDTGGGDTGVRSPSSAGDTSSAGAPPCGADSDRASTSSRA